jgi:dihydrofolate reductase
MRKIKLFIASSMDGFIAKEDGNVDWLYTDGDYGYSSFYKTVDTVLMGMNTYRQALGFGEYPYKGKKGFVFTRTLSGKDRNVEFVSDPVAFTKKLLSSGGKDIWLVGGSEINTLFLRNGLIDELILSVHPVYLGKGIPLFRTEEPVWFRLISSVPYKKGLMQLRYEIVK